MVETHVLLWTTPTANHLCLCYVCRFLSCYSIPRHVHEMPRLCMPCYTMWSVGRYCTGYRPTGTGSYRTAPIGRGYSRPPFARPPFRGSPLEAALCEAPLSSPPPRGLPLRGHPFEAFPRPSASRSPLHRAVDPRDPPGRSLAPCTGHIFHKFRAGSLSILLLRFYDTCNSVVHYSQGTGWIEGVPPAPPLILCTGRHFLILIRYSGRLPFRFLWPVSLCSAQRCLCLSLFAIQLFSMFLPRCPHLCYADIAHERRGKA